MDALARAAITGTSREAPPAGGLPTDDLLRSAEKSPERDLLLRAGMRAVYRAAGRTAETGAGVPGPAPEETLPACSAKAAEILRQLLAGRREELLGEALERLRLAGLRLPHALLPAALDVRLRELRPAVAAVLAERGRWLAGFDPAWGWATGGPERDDETAWEEGALEERLAALRHTRHRDPGRGLACVEEVWKSEKADARSAMVAALEIGLGTDDEPFLERALDDRSVRVREAAVALLARLPGSAYAERAMARADAVIAGYEPPDTGLLRRRRAGRLVVEPPEEVDGGWKRDLPGEKPRGMGEKAWRILRTLAAVPPVHWEKRFDAGPSELVAATRGDWEAALLAGWCGATAAHRSESWALPLWEHCYDFPQGGEGEMVWNAALPLAGLLSSADLAEAFPRLAGSSMMPSRLADTLRSLPGPWDETFSDVYLTALQKTYISASSDERAASRWPDTLQVAAERLSTHRLTRLDARMPAFPEERDRPYQYRQRHWRQELEKFWETLELRRRIVKEIPL